MFNSKFLQSSKAITVALVCIAVSSLSWAQQSAQASAEMPQGKTEDPILFSVGANEAYRLSDVKAYGKRRADLVPLLKSTEGFAMVVQEMAMTRALVLEGQRTHVFQSTDEVAGRDKNLDDIYAIHVYRTVAGACPELKTEQESKAYYDQNPQAFTLPVQLSISRIMFPFNAQVDKFPAEMWLGFQARAVAMGSARFEALVERARENAPQLKQGDLGWVLLEGDQPLIKALSNSKEGELVGPIRDGDFFYLLQVQKRREQALLPFDTVRHQVPRRAADYCRETQKNRVKATLFNQHEIVIDANAIRKLTLQ